MGKKGKGYSESLEEVLSLFEQHVSAADIRAAKQLGEISAAIVKRRMQLQMTQKEFAEYLGVSQSMVSKWEGGDYNFSIKALAEIAEKLHLEMHIDFQLPEETRNKLSPQKIRAVT